MYGKTHGNRQTHANFLPFFKISRIYIWKTTPFFLISRIRASHWKKYPLFAKMCTSMDVHLDWGCLCYKKAQQITNRVFPYIRPGTSIQIFILD